MKDTLTFDQLPEAVTKMQEKLDNIEQLLISRQEQSPKQEELMPITKAAEFLDLAVPTVYSKVCRKEKKSLLISAGSACISIVRNSPNGLSLAGRKRRMNSGKMRYSI